MESSIATNRERAIISKPASVVTNVTCSQIGTGGGSDKHPMPVFTSNGNISRAAVATTIATLTNINNNGISINKNNNNHNHNISARLNNNLNKTSGEQLSSANETASPPDFDFNLPCAYFKSSFARSLSLNNNSSSANQIKSLDFDITNRGNNNPTTPPLIAMKDFPSIPSRMERPTVGNTSCRNTLHLMTDNEASDRINHEDQSLPPAIPARNPLPSVLMHTRRQQPALLTTAVTATRNSGIGDSGANRIISAGLTAAAVVASDGNTNGNCNSKFINNNQLYHHNHHNHNRPHHHHHHHQYHVNGYSSGHYSGSSTTSSSSNGHFIRRNVWPSPLNNDGGGNASEQDCSLILDDAVDQNEIKLSADYAVDNRFDVPDNTTNVEAVILQNQVDTLQWQLKQVETSCEMYRAVMKEVARFLDRYQQKSSMATSNRMEQISRSKSMYHVYGGGDHEKATVERDESPAYLRARSSTNLIDLKRLPSSSTPPPDASATPATVDDHYDIISPASSYSAFKDFTWRRSPKKYSDTLKHLSAFDDTDVKLNQEAFRLSRTIQNLLNTNTQQPDLTQHRNLLGGRRCKAASSILNSSSVPIDRSTESAHPKSNLAAEMLFLRTMTMRDSRLSLRSSTDSSVHSTSSSSKVETDEETTYSPPPLLISNKQISNLCSTTEDESGFSSISSFQDIGVPLCSTMIAAANTTATSIQIDETPAAVDQSSSEFALDSRNSTLKAVPANNVVGIPLNSDTDMQHRWDSPSKTYRNNKFQRFSTLSNEDSATVLWV